MRRAQLQRRGCLQEFRLYSLKGLRSERKTLSAYTEGIAAQPCLSNSNARSSTAKLFAQSYVSTNANECCRVQLYDDAKLCAPSKRGERQRTRQIGALLAEDGAFAISQPHWRSLVERENGVVRAENLSTDDEGKREAFYNEQGMVDRDVNHFNGRVDVAAYLSAGPSNANDVRCNASLD